MPSNSSETSHASNASHTSRSSEEQFAFSPAVTPSKDNAPSRIMTSGYAAGHAAVKDGLLFGKGTCAFLFPAFPCRTGLDSNPSRVSTMLLDRWTGPLSHEAPGIALFPEAMGWSNAGAADRSPG